MQTDGEPYVRLDKNGQRRGGAREGAGRPCSRPLPSEPHKRRVAFSPRTPIHVVTRIVPRIGNLRRRDLYQCIRWASFIVAKHEGARIIHLSVQRAQLHMIVEASNKVALAKSMQSFLISAAKRVNRAVGGHGCVFCDRYRPTVLRTPREVRASIAYVLNHWRLAGEDRGHRSKLDPYASGFSFWGWKKLDGGVVGYRPPPSHQSLLVWIPKTWLLSTGWRKYGLIDENEVPRAS